MTQALDAPPDLGAAILEAERRRAVSWRKQFIVVWILILAGLSSFLIIKINLKVDFLASVIPFIVGGAGATIFVSLIAIFFAVILASLGALGRLSRNPYANGVASFYVSLVRGTPLLLQVMFIYLALPQAGIVLPELACGIIALAFNYGAYMTEIFRAGIQAVPPGQNEAAESLGMDGRTTFMRIIAPQAFRIVTPAIGNDFIAMLKDSSLVSVIGVHELMFNAQVAGRPTYQSMQTLMVAAGVYWVMTIMFSFVQARLEKNMAGADRGKGSVQ